MDLRTWIEDVDRRGKLKVIRGAHWDLEIGGITELAVKKSASPTLLFDDIVGHAPGFRIITNTLTHSSEDPERVALALGFDAEGITTQALVNKIKDQLPSWEATAKTSMPQWVNTGPVLEEVYRDDEVDMLKFPSPRWHEKDGGRYIGTGSAVITRDPETDQLNIGTYRIMVHDKRRLGIFMAPVRHGLSDMQKYHRKGQKAPVIICLGQHPLFTVVGGTPIPRSMGPAQEFGYLGAIQKSPIKVVRGELTGLPIPADAEIAVEGYWNAGDEMDEGPFGEFTGYYGGMREPAPFITVERLYHRGNPILLGSCPGKHPSYGTDVLSSAMWLRYLEAAGCVGVTMVAQHRLAARQMTAVSIKQRYPGHAREIGHIAAQVVGRGLGRYLIVVDDDIDATDIEDVTFAMATRADPAQDIDIIRRAYSQRLDPMIPEGTPRDQTFSSRAVIDACIPYERLKNFPAVAAISREYAATIRAKWGTTLDLA